MTVPSILIMAIGVATLIVLAALLRYVANEGRELLRSSRGHQARRRLSAQAHLERRLNRQDQFGAGRPSGAWIGPARYGDANTLNYDNITRSVTLKPTLVIE
jgi:hypothetical protein